MSYYPDLHTASMLGHGDRLRAIGWLHPDHDFVRGSVSDENLAVIRSHLATAFQPCAFGGVHQCEFCLKSIGSLNLLVPTLDVVYVAPEMLIHYITEHSYQPPAEFFDALAQCPVQESPEYMALLAPYFPYFHVRPPDPLPTPEQRSRLARMLSRAFRDIARLCREGNTKAATALASACDKLPEKIHGWGLWYRFIFSRLVRNGGQHYPALDGYLAEYNDIFGEDTDPEPTTHTDPADSDD